jgi:hypothetical protein
MQDSFTLSLSETLRLAFYLFVSSVIIVFCLLKTKAFYIPKTNAHKTDMYGQRW